MIAEGESAERRFGVPGGRSRAGSAPLLKRAH
jgi:hypothetical protein